MFPSLWGKQNKNFTAKQFVGMSGLQSRKNRFNAVTDSEPSTVQRITCMFLQRAHPYSLEACPDSTFPVGKSDLIM